MGLAEFCLHGICYLKQNCCWYITFQVEYVPWEPSILTQYSVRIAWMAVSLGRRVGWSFQARLLRADLFHTSPAGSTGRVSAAPSDTKPTTRTPPEAIADQQNGRPLPRSFRQAAASPRPVPVQVPPLQSVPSVPSALFRRFSLGGAVWPEACRSNAKADDWRSGAEQVLVNTGDGRGSGYQWEMELPVWLVMVVVVAGGGEVSAQQTPNFTNQSDFFLTNFASLEVYVSHVQLYIHIFSSDGQHLKTMASIFYSLSQYLP